MSILKQYNTATMTWVPVVVGATGVQGIQGTAANVQGLTGAQGLQGTQGTQGIAGQQGLQGAQGTQGIQGLQGIQGRQGLQGQQGIQGLTGAQGTTGSQGIQGIQGTQGIQGIQGTQGLQGIRGPQGIQGLLGVQGIAGQQGIQGSQGIQGAVGSSIIEEFTATASQTTFTLANTYTPGQVQVYANGINLPSANFTANNGTTVVLDTGRNAGDIIKVIYGNLAPIGIQGTQGLTGGGSSITVSDTAPSSPSSGALWWDSVNGKLMIYYVDGSSNQWVDASPAIAGPQGSQGIQGSQGTQGITGQQGIQGTQGLLGVQGIQGAQGVQGSQGIQGIQGTLIPATDFWENMSGIVAATNTTRFESNTQYFENLKNYIPINAQQLRKFGNLSWNTARVDQTQTTASRSAVYEQFIRFAVGLYTQGTGTNNSNLYSLSTFSNEFRIQSSITGTNNNTNFVSVRYTYPNNQGDSTTGSFTYSVSGTRFTLLTSQMSDFSGNLHVPVSISQVINPTTPIFVNVWADSGTGFTADTTSRWISMTSNNIRFAYFIVQQSLIPTFEPLGTTDSTPMRPGFGIFTSAATGFANPVAFSQIATSASHPTPYYQLLNTNFTNI